MAYGIVGFSQQNNLDQPSGAIFGDCSAEELLDEGSGYFDFKDFKTRLPAFLDGGSSATASTSAVAWWIDSGTATYNANYDSVLTLTTGATLYDDAGIATRPVGPIAPGSGQKVWFEALVSVGTASGQGMFIGLANQAALGSKNLLSQSSTATYANNLIGGASKSSFYGFWAIPTVYNSSTAPLGTGGVNFHAVWANQITTAMTPAQFAAYSANTAKSSGTGVVLQNVLTPTITQYPNSLNPLGYVGPTPVSVPPGALIATATANATPVGYGTAQTPQQLLHIGLPPSVGTTLGATGFVKLGIRYDGQQYLYFYVNGVQTAKMVITSGNDTVSNFGGIAVIQAGAAAAVTLNLGFERTASLIYP
jgi:hypothetical protein